MEEQCVWNMSSSAITKRLCKRKRWRDKEGEERDREGRIKGEERGRDKWKERQRDEWKESDEWKERDRGSQKESEEKALGQRELARPWRAFSSRL